MTVERQRLVAWEKTARGKGLRWRILRDVVACLRLHWMTFEELNHVMLKLRGLTRNKLREMLSELQETGDLDHVLDKRIQRWVYGATLQGAGFWINGTVGIPAGIVEAVQIMRHARALELGEMDESDAETKMSSL
ncbi:hypothetical protein ES708_27949 [subsurface metagenome]